MFLKGMLAGFARGREDGWAFIDEVMVEGKLSMEDTFDGFPSPMGVCWQERLTVAFVLRRIMKPTVFVGDGNSSFLHQCSPFGTP